MKTCSVHFPFQYIQYVISCMLLLPLCLDAQKSEASIPYLQKHGTATQLILGTKPFLILGGELGNSSASNVEYLRPYWQGFRKMHVNTILAPVYWDLMEPTEGSYKFNLVDSLITNARRNEMKLILLWFGSWKNSMSCYVPTWIKTNQQRFPRVRTKDGNALEILTPFNNENKTVDAQAFANLLKHLYKIDGKQHTVIMVQVENEIGMLRDARDYSSDANILFAQPVPAEFINYMQDNNTTLTPELSVAWQSNGGKTSGTWEEIFGNSLQTDEFFMAWYFGQYTNFVAEAGKKEYPLPMFVNAALNRIGYKPGQYPSAGPLPHLFDVWKAAAPNIDFLSPDIYFNNFAEWCMKYVRQGNPLFVPEVANSQSVANAYYAIAQLGAMGYSPFSIESLEHPEDNSVSKGYAVLQQLSPLILEHQGTSTLAGVLLDSSDQKEKISLGDYVFNIKHEYSWAYAARTSGELPRVGGLILMLSPDEFLIAGSGIVITFESHLSDGSIAGIDRMEEGKFANGKWIAGRRMNGDQNHQGRHMHLPGGEFSMQKIKLYTYK
jgi:beta-galactosidase GanA